MKQEDRADRWTHVRRTDVYVTELLSRRAVAEAVVQFSIQQ